MCYVNPQGCKPASCSYSIFISYNSASFSLSHIQEFPASLTRQIHFYLRIFILSIPSALMFYRNLDDSCIHITQVYDQLSSQSNHSRTIQLFFLTPDCSNLLLPGYFITFMPASHSLHLCLMISFHKPKCKPQEDKRTFICF